MLEINEGVKKNIKNTQTNESQCFDCIIPNQYKFIGAENRTHQQHQHREQKYKLAICFSSVLIVVGSYLNANVLFWLWCDTSVEFATANQQGVHTDLQQFLFLGFWLCAYIVIQQRWCICSKIELWKRDHKSWNITVWSNQAKETRVRAPRFRGVWRIDKSPLLILNHHCPTNLSWIAFFAHTHFEWFVATLARNRSEKKTHQTDVKSRLQARNKKWIRIECTSTCIMCSNSCCVDGDDDNDLTENCLTKNQGNIWLCFDALCFFSASTHSQPFLLFHF